jgi:hypothetical protein
VETYGIVAMLVGPESARIAGAADFDARWRRRIVS